MVSIPLGTAEIQLAHLEADHQTYMEALLPQLHAVVQAVVARCIEALLDAEVTALLGRAPYERRATAPRRVTSQAQCNRCGTRATWQFHRDGTHPQTLASSWGPLAFRMPQLACACEGSVHLELQTVRPYQRIWEDAAAAMREHYGWGESLRAIKAHLDRQLGRSLSLRTINERVHAIAQLVPRWQQTPQVECPPVVRLDGVWVPQLVPTGQVRADARGRLRPVKAGVRRPVLVAQGVWPARGRQAVVGWVLGTAEGTADWTRLLQQLWDRQIRPQRGLQLLVADGTAGLPRARQLVYWNVPFQRCVFHKLRNVWQALGVPEDLSAQAGQAYKRRLIRQAAQVWQAAQVTTARQRQTDWCLRWETEQPAAVATMQRDFEQTLTFYGVQATAERHGVAWPPTQLRTTSHLERLFRGVRRRVRRALALHSDVGLTALVQQCFARWAAGQSDSRQERADWPLRLEQALATTPPISL